MATVHTHWQGGSRDCDGTYLYNGTFAYTDTVGEVLAQIVADQYHACDDLNGGQRPGRYCDWYEHGRETTIRSDETVAVHDGVPYVQGWIVETRAHTEEGYRYDEYHIHDADCPVKGGATRRDLTAEAAGY